MLNPGLEPGSPAWKAEIIPIDQFGFIKKSKADEGFEPTSLTNYVSTLPLS